MAVNSRGILKGLKAGTAKITVKSKADPGKKASITVEVTKDVLVGSVKLNKKKITAEEFQEEKIPLHVTKILPSNAQNKKVVWSTSDKDVANVDHTGTVTVGEEGTAVITASAADKGGAYAECRVTVTEKEDQDDDEDDDAETQAPPVVPTQNPGALEPGVVTAEPATAEPGGVTAEPATEKPDDVTAEPATEKPDDATEKPTKKPTSPPATKRPRPTKKPTSPPATKKPAWTPDPDVAAKVENVSIKYDYEFPGTRMVRFDGTVVDHNNMDEPETYENAKAEGYPEGGIDVRYYEKVIVKYEGKKLTGDGDWFGKATLSSTGEWLGQNEYADGLFLKYLNDVECEGGYRNGIYTVEYNIDETRMVDGFDFYDAELIDCISVELAAEDEYAGFRLLSVDFIAPGKEPVPVPTNRPTARPGVETTVPVPVPTNRPPFSGSLANPETDSTGTTTWDCVWFGDYWQEDTNGDGKADKNDAKQPLKWRVLSVDGDDAFLLADQNLDCQTYNDNWVDVTWETCSMRSWLNGYGVKANGPGKDYSGDNFLANAFSESERSAIRTTRVVNGDNPDPEYGTEGGNDTSDKVYLLSIGEATNPAYGFSSDYSKEDEGRRAKNTAYAEAQGAWIPTEEYDGNGFWWLRSPGRDGVIASRVDYFGYVDADGSPVDNWCVAVRPALHLNLSSSSGWSYAGTVTSEGGDRPGVETAVPVPVPSYHPTAHPGVETGVPVPVPSYHPTARPGVETEVPVPISPIPRPTSPPFSGSLANPETDSTGTTTWDCVWFGDYWQEDTNGDGKADKNDAKQPVKWRVLSVDGDDAFLLADQNLDCQTYNDNHVDVTWETCSMRSWLNGYGAEANEPGKDYSGDNFLDNAFTGAEQRAIRTTNVVNDDNPEYGTEGGNNTSDKVYLLSIGEATNPAYGFSSNYSKLDKSRRAKNTAYAEAQGAWTAIDQEHDDEYAGGFWWLRSPGSGSNFASLVDYIGYVNALGDTVDDYSDAVRPALHLNLSSSSGWSYAGTVTSEGGDRPGVETD